MSFQSFMKEALIEAMNAARAGEVPVGAVLVLDGQIIARGQNRTRRDNDPTAHAEVVAIREACKTLGDYRATECEIYVTLEPCAMCAGAISEARIKRLYFGADDPKSGGTFHGAKVFSHKECHHKPEIYEGIGANESMRILQDFFQSRR